MVSVLWQNICLIKLEELRKLIFHHNKLTKLTFISPSAQNNTQIELQQNNLRSLDESIGACINLQHLNISYNKLSSLNLYQNALNYNHLKQ